MLLNLQLLQWDPGMIELMGVEEKMLPAVTPSIDPQGWGTTLTDGPFGGTGADLRESGRSAGSPGRPMLL